MLVTPSFQYATPLMAMVAIPPVRIYEGRQPAHLFLSYGWKGEWMEGLKTYCLATSATSLTWRLIGLLNILLGGHGMPNKVNEIRRLEELNKHPGLGY